MNFFKDISDTLLKYGDIIVKKTEELAFSAKQLMAIKLLQGDLDSVLGKIGTHVFEKIEKNEAINPSGDTALSALVESARGIIQKIEAKKKEIDSLKESGAGKA